jgi:hypothetical protein
MCKLMNSLGLDELYECTGDNYYKILRWELKDLVRQFILRNIDSTVHSCFVTLHEEVMSILVDRHCVSP